MNALNLDDPSQRQHLSDDAEFAEDLAIRYADVHWGLHTNHFEGIAEYRRARDECMASLFKAAGNNHNVSEQEVRRSLGNRRVGFDMAVILSFFLFYGWGASVIARWLCRLYGFGESFAIVVVMTTVASVITSIVGVMLGEEWSWMFESYRLGNGHMSYRAVRIPWTHHHLELFIASLALFWLLAVFHRWNVLKSEESKPPPHTSTLHIA